MVANGVYLPTKRRAYTRGPDRGPIPEMLMVAIDISDVSFIKKSLTHRGLAVWEILGKAVLAFAQ
jgi:hypothetical protein